MTFKALTTTFWTLLLALPLQPLAALTSAEAPLVQMLALTAWVAGVKLRLASPSVKIARMLVMIWANFLVDFMWSPC